MGKEIYASDVVVGKEISASDVVVGKKLFVGFVVKYAVATNNPADVAVDYNIFAASLQYHRCLYIKTRRI